MPQSLTPGSDSSASFFGPWRVPEVSLSGEYTILSKTHTYFNQTFTPRSLEALKLAFPEKSYAALVYYRPERLLLHECIIQVVTQLQLDGETHMHKTVRELYESVMKAHSNTLEELAKAPASDCEAAIHEAHQAHIRTVLKPLVTTEIQKFCNDAKATLLPLPETSSERKTYLLAGGIASGKGASAWKVKLDAESNGIPYAALVKINGDSLKPLLLEPGSVSAAAYSQLCVDEATFIKAQIFERLHALAKIGKAPHTFIDETGLKETAIKYATENDGAMTVIIVSTEVKDAVVRSFTRGAKDGVKGRYEHTKNILANHRAVATGILKFLVQLPSDEHPNITLTFVDNNVPEGEGTQIFCTVNLQTRKMMMHDKEQLMAFIKKTFINVDAATPEEVYTDLETGVLDRAVAEFLATITANGYEIKLPEPLHEAASVLT